MYSVFILSMRDHNTPCVAARTVTRKKTDPKRQRPWLLLGYILGESMNMVNGAFRFSLPEAEPRTHKGGRSLTWMRVLPAFVCVIVSSVLFRLASVDLGKGFWEDCVPSGTKARTSRQRSSHPPGRLPLAPRKPGSAYQSTRCTEMLALNENWWP